MNPAVEAAARLAGVDLNQAASRRLEELAHWLREEGVKSGGLGPSEVPAIESRHIADSMLFAVAWLAPPRQCWDLGSGVGLPGLVLAVIWPSCEVTLIDRSQRRLDLARRAARVAGITVATRLSDISRLQGPVEAVVSRAAVPASRLLPHLRRILAPGGLAVVSGRAGDAQVPGYEAVVGAGTMEGSLAAAPRLLMMRNP